MNKIICRFMENNDLPIYREHGLLFYREHGLLFYGDR